MIHQYKNNDYNIVLDVCSGAVHVVDDVVYDVIALYEQDGFREFVDKLSSKYKEDDIKEAYEEIEELIEEGLLFAEDEYKEYVIDFKKRQTVVKALCLHIAHDCNLASKFCFAGKGEYNGVKSLMSLEVG